MAYNGRVLPKRPNRIHHPLVSVTLCLGGVSSLRRIAPALPPNILHYSATM